MAVNTYSVLNLITALSEKLEESTDRAGFEKMSRELDEEKVSGRYLADVHKQVQEALDKKKMTIGIRRYKLDHIALFLGFRNFQRFENEYARPPDPVLTACIGNWWSMVRANSGAYILKAPVSIYRSDDGRQVNMKLRGRQHLFTGTIVFRAGCLFCTLDSEQAKKLFIVFKAGTVKNTLLMQGVFTGISSAGDPIAGRELLVREGKLSFEEMSWQKLTTDDAQTDTRICSYFKEYEGNCIKISGASSFDLTDLDT